MLRAACSKQGNRCERQRSRGKVQDHVKEKMHVCPCARTREDHPTHKPDGIHSRAPLSSLLYIFITKKHCKVKSGSLRTKSKEKEQNMLPQTLTENGDLFCLYFYLNCLSIHRSVTLLLLLHYNTTCFLLPATQRGLPPAQPSILSDLVRRQISLSLMGEC